VAKSKNRKRAKLLRKRKKEREKQTLFNDNLLKDRQMLLEKAEKENIKIIDRALLGRKEKISSVLLEMIKPVLFTAQDEKDARGIVSMGVLAWNFGIIRQTLGEDKLNDAMKLLKIKEDSYERILLEEYIQLKCNQFGQYNDFITDFNISFERDGRMNFTVLAGITDDIAKTLKS
jgi:hypothetical protein